MKSKTWIGMTVALCVVVFVASNVFSQDKEAKPAPKKPAGEMNPQMKIWMQAAMPGPNHKLLNYCVGTWNAVVRSWWQPGAEPESSKGVSVNHWVLGGRYVESRYAGEAMGRPFEGIGYSGYDNVKKVFTSCWMDTMGTGMMIDEGSYDASTKTFTYENEMPIATGGMMKTKTTIRIVDQNQHIMTMYQRMPGMDKMAKMMEITYTRADKKTETK